MRDKPKGNRKNRVVRFLAWVVSGFIVKMASWRLPKKASMISAPVIIKIPIILKLGDICASANVNSIKPRTSKKAEMYSWTGYFLLRPGMNAPIIITGNTWNPFEQFSKHLATLNSMRLFKIVEVPWWIWTWSEQDNWDKPKSLWLSHVSPWEQQRVWHKFS